MYVVATVAVDLCVLPSFFAIPVEPLSGVSRLLLYVGQSHTLAAYITLGITTA